jgi:hypothetical protein
VPWNSCWLRQQGALEQALRRALGPSPHPPGAHARRPLRRLGKYELREVLSIINPVGGRQSTSESLEDDTTTLLMTLAKYVDRRGLSPEGFAMCYNQGGGEQCPCRCPCRIWGRLAGCKGVAREAAAGCAVLSCGRRTAERRAWLWPIRAEGFGG